MSSFSGLQHRLQLKLTVSQLLHLVCTITIIHAQGLMSLDVPIFTSGKMCESVCTTFMSHNTCVILEVYFHDNGFCPYLGGIYNQEKHKRQTTKVWYLLVTVAHIWFRGQYLQRSSDQQAQHHGSYSLCYVQTPWNSPSQLDFSVHKSTSKLTNLHVKMHIVFPTVNVTHCS